VHVRGFRPLKYRLCSKDRVVAFIVLLYIIQRGESPEVWRVFWLSVPWGTGVA
jgi:hypothetical protein